MHGPIMTSTPPNKIVEYFPQKNTDRIISQPNYKYIRSVYGMVNENAISVC